MLQYKGIKRLRFTSGSIVSNPPAIAGDVGLIPGSRSTLEKKMATHSSSLGLGNPMDRGAWQATVHGVAKAQDMT